VGRRASQVLEERAPARDRRLFAGASRSLIRQGAASRGASPTPRSETGQDSARHKPSEVGDDRWRGSLARGERSATPSRALTGVATLCPARRMLHQRGRNGSSAAAPVSRRASGEGPRRCAGGNSNSPRRPAPFSFFFFFLFSLVCCPGPSPPPLAFAIALGVGDVADVVVGRLKAVSCLVGRRGIDRPWRAYAVRRGLMLAVMRGVHGSMPSRQWLMRFLGFSGPNAFCLLTRSLKVAPAFGQGGGGGGGGGGGPGGGASGDDPGPTLVSSNRDGKRVNAGRFRRRNTLRS